MKTPHELPRTLHIAIRPLRALLIATGLLTATSLVAADSPWVSLFDGKTLDGWTIKGGKATYKVEDESIVATTVKRTPKTFLSRAPYADFDLQFDVLCDKPLNSGVRSKDHTPKLSQRRN